MKEIDKEEMFGNLKGFLKSKGIELQEGSYADGIRKGCDLLTDTVNVSQRAFDRAKNAVDKGLDQVRQSIHEKTAPKGSSAKAAGAAAKKKSTPRGKKSRK